MSRYYVINDTPNIGEDIRKALSSLIDEPKVGLVVIQEDYIKYVDDLVSQIKEGGKMTPILIEVPSKHGTQYQDVSQYYKAYIRKSIGFDVEI